MNDDPDIPALKEAFAALKRRERAAAPDFRRVLVRARARASGMRPSSAARRLIPATVAAVLLAVAIRALDRPEGDAPQTTLAKALPALLAPGADRVAWLDSLPSPAGTVPTDCLLPFHLTVDLF